MSGSYVRASRCLLLMALWASPLFAQDARPASRHVQAAILLEDHPEPILGEADCQADMPCQVLYSFDLGLEVTITLPSHDESDGGAITIRCADDCSFTPGRAYITFSGERQFELYHGEIDARNLVLISRLRMGTLSLIIE